MIKECVNMTDNKTNIFTKITNLLLNDKKEEAREFIISKYPHNVIDIKKRKYSLNNMLEQFFKDGFIDRYTGERLINPGLLKVLSVNFPDVFPYHLHWKTTKTHIAYWIFFPTLDHIVPIARGGEDESSNWVTTSMKNNLIKNNYTLEELRWNLYPKGDIEDWDGLTKIFIDLVEKDNSLLEDAYIKRWYNATKNIYNKFSFKKI